MENLQFGYNRTIRDRNVKECLEVSDIVKSSLGPVSFDKMIISEIGDITFTNDGANILQKMEIVHPAAKILVNLSNQQDSEVGDGTTSVVIITCELLKRANNLIQKKIHPSIIISAYRLAMCHTCSLIREKLCIPINFLDSKILLNVAKTSLSSKISGFISHKFALIALKAVKSVQMYEKKGTRKKCQIKGINFVKIHGNSINSSCIFDGCILEEQKLSQIMTSYLAPLKIVCFNFDLKVTKPKMGINIENQNPFELKRIFDNEIKSIITFVRKMIEDGINLIFTSRGIDEFLIKYLIKNGIIAIRRTTKENLKKISMVTGAKIQNNFHCMKFYQASDFIHIGEAEEFFENEITSNNFSFIRGCRFCPASSIILRGATGFLLDEISQSLTDAICVIKRAIEGNKLVSGGGAIETNLSVALEKLAISIPTREQLGILEFAESLLVIPKTLLKNAGLNHIEILSKLKILHINSLDPEFSYYKYYGVDLLKGKIVNHLYTGVIEPMINKIKCIQIATEAAITLLRIDDFIVCKKKE